MTTGRRASDWIAGPACPAHEGERRGEDRRGYERRAPRRRIDPLFAMTLINQVVPAAIPIVGSPYERTPALRCGVVRNIRA